jgi:hypothetical protein
VQSTALVGRKTNAFNPLTVITSAPRRQVSSIGICATGGTACHRCSAGPSLAAIFDSSSNGPRGLLGWSRIGAQAVRARGRVPALAAVSGPAVGLVVVDRSLFGLLAC